MPCHAILPILLLVGGCAGLPTTGPTAKDVVRVASKPNPIGMRLVDISPDVVAAVGQEDQVLDSQDPTLASLATFAATANDRVGPGDILTVGLYEVGIGLFGGMSGDNGSLKPAAQGQDFSAVPINRDGDIKLPYVGPLHVAGLTPDDVARLIEKAYAGRSQAPQAIVGLRRNVRNTVYVTGDVRKPGRMELTLRSERLLDAISDAGGAVSQAQDMVVRVSRGGRIVEERLDRIRAGASDDIVLSASDVIELIKAPQTYSAFGAVPRVMQISFDQSDLTLAEAVARAGGPNDALANPKAIFLFRYRRSITGQPPIPTIYRLNFMNPTGYFLSQKFRMRNKDILYVSTANINRLSKFIAILNQLASPIITARAIQQ
jgi:polysaccharide export outer membrane protein